MTKGPTSCHHFNIKWRRRFKIRNEYDGGVGGLIDLMSVHGGTVSLKKKIKKISTSEWDNDPDQNLKNGVY